MNDKPSPNKGKKLPPEVLTKEEVLKLISCITNRYPTGKRNRALIAMLYRAGLRISEALALLPKDIDPQSGRIAILHGKGDRARIVGMSPEGWVIMQRWMDCRAVMGFNGCHPVFCTIKGALKGSPLDTRDTRNLLTRLARRAGIEKRVHAHGFRHTCASEMLDEGCQLRDIQGMLGHARISTTALYLEKANPKHVVDCMRGRSWKPPVTLPEEDAQKPCVVCGKMSLMSGILPDGRIRFYCRQCKKWFLSSTPPKAHVDFVRSLRALTRLPRKR